MTHPLCKKTSTHLGFALAILTGTSSFFVSACASRTCAGGTDCFSSPEQPPADGLGGDSGSKKPGVLDDEHALALGGNGGETPKMGSVEPLTPEEPSCVPGLEPDTPDDDFSDTNCDGIDGDIATAIFVSPLGNDSAAGTMENPVMTLAEGIRLAQESSRDVYICNATYAEPLNIKDVGVNIFGGYDCGKDWERGASLAVVSPSSGTPLLVQNVTGVRIEQLHFRAAAATTQGGSSIGSVIVDSKQVQLHGVAVEAGAGFSGTDGSAGAVYTTRARAGANSTGTCAFAGCSPGGKGGYSPASFICPDGSKERQGGAGGDGANYQPVVAATNGSNALFTLNAGGIVSSTPALRVGKAGYNGSQGANGESVVSAMGLFQNFVYQTSNGSAGGAGGKAPGGGGGAGAATRWFGDIQQGSGDGGGQGGSGGCGGRAGTGGTGGGGSFGIVVANSELTITRSELSSSEGGNGGAGGAGAAGQLGGAGGKSPGTVNPGGAGGRGGNGGKGGDGSPGAGGPSIVVALLSGQAPIIVDTTLEALDGGRGGKVPAGGYGPVGLSSEGYDFALRQELQF